MNNAETIRTLIDTPDHSGSIVVDGLMFKQGTPEWLEWRRNGITATEASAAFGVSKWSSRKSKWRSVSQTFRSFIKPSKTWQKWQHPLR